MENKTDNLQLVLKWSKFTCSLNIQNGFLRVFSDMDLHMRTRILKG